MFHPFACIPFGSSVKQVFIPILTTQGCILLGIILRHFGVPDRFALQRRLPTVCSLLQLQQNVTCVNCQAGQFVWKAIRQFYASFQSVRLETKSEINSPILSRLPKLCDSGAEIATTILCGQRASWRSP